MSRPFYETATRGQERRAQGNIVDYLQRRFAEEKKRNPQCIGGSYSPRKGITFRYAATPDKTAQQKQYQEWIKTRLWWAKQGVFI